MPWASVGGTEHATLRIAGETAAHGIRSTMFCYEAATEVREFFYNAGFDTAVYQAVEPLVVPQNTSTRRANLRERRGGKPCKTSCAMISLGNVVPPN